MRVTQARNKALAALSSGQILLAILCAILLIITLVLGLGWRHERALRRAEHEAVVGILEERAGLEQ